MADIFVAAYKNGNAKNFRQTTDMCMAIRWMDSMRYLMVVEDTLTGGLAAWFSLRERSSTDTYLTKVTRPEAWEITMCLKLREDIRILETNYGLQPVIKKPSHRPSEILADLLASHLFDDRPDFIDHNFFVLDTLVVKPANQQQGIGKEILQYTCNFASRHGLRILARVPEESRIARMLSNVDFRSTSGVEIRWGDNFQSAATEDVYVVMEFPPKDNDHSTTSTLFSSA